MEFSTLKRSLSNIPGFRSNRKIVVFESDDWGSIRMPSIAAFSRLDKAGVDLRSCTAERYNLYDTLASENDLAGLFEVLSRFKDSQDNNPVFTALAIVANPDFQKIKESGFSKYYYEPFTENLKRIPGCENSLKLWKEGIERKIFIPEMHGREHLNVSAWLRALQKGDKKTLSAFDEGMWGFVPDQKVFPGIDFQAAFQLADPQEINYHKEIIEDGLDLFEKIFGYKAQYFVPPNGPFNNKLNVTLSSGGIKYRSTSKVQKESLGNGKTRNVIHWLGQKEDGITYITRNCFFEPSPHNEDWVDKCLSDINIAFKWHKPAIVSTHRVNFIGSLIASNRDRTLKSLGQLLGQIIKNWPEVEFLTTSELGKLINA